MLNFFFGFGTIIYVSLLVTNAIAILSEERFLARVGWSANAPRNVNSGFGSAPHGFGGGFSQDGGLQGEGPGIKDKLIHLITAVRTLMRIPLIALNIVVILYELVWG